MADSTARKLLIVTELLSSSSSSDDESGLLTERIKKPKIQNFIEIVHEFSDEEFRRNFRLSRLTAYSLIQRYEAAPYHPVDETHGGSPPLSAEHDILTFLWFAGNKVALRDVGQRFGVGTTTTFNQIERVMEYLIHIAPNVIHFPVDNEQASTEFFNISGFPDTIGCIDGTSITIRTPANKIKSTYVNRHDIPSLTLQAICNATKQFIDISVGAPAKIHDARVYQLSEISLELPRICNRTYHIIGDSAYPIREWLLVPFRDYGNLTNDQKLYNKKFCSTRVLIENSFGLLKARFRQLLEVHMRDVDKICRFVLSCCVLHNFCIEFNDEFHYHPVMENLEDDEMDFDTERLLKQQGEEKRQNIMERLVRDYE